MSDYRVTAFKKVFVIASGLACAVLLARYLGPELRAEYAVVMNSAAIIMVLLNLGVGNSYQSARREFGIREMPVFLGISTASGLLALLVAIVCFCLDSENLGLILIVSGIGLYRLQLQSYGLVESISGSAVASMLGGIGELLTIFLLWMFFPSSLYLGLLAILVKDFLISVVSLKVVYGAYRDQDLAASISIGRLAGFTRGLAHIKKSIPVFMLTLMIIVNYKVDVLILDYMSVDKHTIGVFSIGVLLAEYLWIFSDIFKDVQTSRTARGGGAEDVAKANRLAFFVTVVAYVLFLVSGTFLVEFFFGKDYSASFGYAAVMLVANIFMIPCKILGAYYISIGRVMPYLYAMAISVFMNVILNFLLIPSLGAYGALFASIASYAFVGVFILFDFSRTSGVPLVRVVLIRASEVSQLAGGFFRKH
jgi:O-antigen/teichoic acid export membrane protein